MIKLHVASPASNPRRRGGGAPSLALDGTPAQDLVRFVPLQEHDTFAIPIMLERVETILLELTQTQVRGSRQDILDRIENRALCDGHRHTAEWSGVAENPINHWKAKLGHVNPYTRTIP